MRLSIHTLNYCGSERLKPLHPLFVQDLHFAEHTSTAIIWKQWSR
ncbi:hypothetical protein HBZC1_p0750 (plasmid) [Helicobacter bizzozeronii CIII-1]|uniref:Uncharacterized protein n=1 Tax=Helicobacter bizzozeronii (strain CIII-1) TaxID=1002804 RepID=F8KUM0_HELBC|nr:hypothetical protein HBZC1_p0750 [Helicobacter bizzozeronii CIII-1]